MLLTFELELRVLSLHMIRQQSIQRSIAWGGIIAVLLQANALILMMGLFALNSDRLTVQVCEKKVPNCHARCYLRKQLSRANEDSNAPSGRVPSSQGSHLSGEYLLTSQIIPSAMVVSSVRPDRTTTPQLLDGFLASPFAPPKV